MRKSLFQEIQIPEGVTISLDENMVTVKGPEGEVSKKFNLGKVNSKLSENKIELGNEKATKTEKKIINTSIAHLNNMIKGVQEKFIYELKVCFGHFPITVKKEEDKVIVKNFLGEKINRTVNIPTGADVEINKDIITIKSVNKEIAGQAAANFEKATIVRKRDSRVFQDGIYITKKAGKEI